MNQVLLIIFNSIVLQNPPLFFCSNRKLVKALFVHQSDLFLKMTDYIRMTSSAFTKTQQQLGKQHRNELDFDNYDEYEKHDEDYDVEINRSNYQEEEEEKEGHSDDQYSSDCSRSTLNLGDFAFRILIIEMIQSFVSVISYFVFFIICYPLL